MSNVNGKDDDGFPTIFGVSDLDGVTPVKIQFDPATRVMLVDTTTTISFDPTVNINQDVNKAYPFAKATAATTSGDFVADVTTRPWVVNHATGAVLVDLI